MILVTTSRRADPLVRRIGRGLAFAVGGRYVTRGKGGLSRPPFSEGMVLVLCRDGEGIRMQLFEGMREEVSLRFTSVREEARTGLLKRGLFTGDEELLSLLSPRLPVNREERYPHALLLDGIQGRRISLGV